jgi:4-hydroxy-2-oxoheptanedioate aldolase
MDLPKNTFKAALKAGKQQIGLWVSIANAASAAAVATCGFERIMDAGAQMILVPYVQTAEEARGGTANTGQPFWRYSELHRHSE